MGLSRQEQETVIVFNEADTEATVYTCHGKFKRKLAEAVMEYPEQVKLISEDEYSVKYTIPKRWVKISAPRKMSEEQRQAVSERLSKFRGNSQSACFASRTQVDSEDGSFSESNFTQKEIEH